MKFFLTLLCGIVTGGAVVFVWFVWRFKDVYR